MSRTQRGFSSALPKRPMTSREIYQSTRYASLGGSESDIFAVNPLKRSAIIAGICWLMVLIPIVFLEGHVQATALIAGGWLAAAGIVFVTPIFFWSLAEVGWERIRWRVSPTIDDLDLSPRAYNLLRRHGFETINSVDLTPDVSLMLLSNMDNSALREIRRAINIWKYLRWQEKGFPAGEAP
ncbi:hypothetical protein BH24CHL1_BH24CHL1_15010 [soil metagenome]